MTDSPSYLLDDFPPGVISVADMLGQIAAGLKASSWDQPFHIYQDARSGEIAAVDGPPNPEQLMKVYAEAEDILLTALRRRALSAQVESDGARRQISATFWQTGAGFDSFRDHRVGGAEFFVEETCFDVWLEQLLLARKGRNDDTPDAPQDMPNADVAGKPSGLRLTETASGGSLRRTPRPEKEYWQLARAKAMKWLEDEGSPAAEFGAQARLEECISNFLADRHKYPAESTIRIHVKNWVVEFEDSRRSN